jgi:hypothetical protein
MYVAFDPGKVTGWAIFKDDGSVNTIGQATIEELITLVEKLVLDNLSEPILAVVYEDFIIFKHKAKYLAGSRVEASQAIGIIKGLAQRTGAELVMQGSDIKPMAQRWTQIKPPADHAESHKIDAFNHGAYYLINKGIRKTALEEEIEAAKKVVLGEV